jgi:hypothetical protein
MNLEESKVFLIMSITPESPEDKDGIRGGDNAANIRDKN